MSNSSSLENEAEHVHTGTLSIKSSYEFSKLYVDLNWVNL